MSLAGMICFDRPALECDMAETYGIYDLRSLPTKTIATLASGLRGDSRIRMKMRGETALRTDIAIAMIYDLLSEMLYAEGRMKQKPDSMVEALSGISNDKVSEYEGYDTVEAYEEARRRIGGA